MQSRYYDPELGRFINADAYASTGQGVLGNNMFAYCLNNPVRYIDSEGQEATEACYSDDPRDDMFPKMDGAPTNIAQQSSQSSAFGNSYNYNGSKGPAYATKRGWTPDMINSAIQSGAKGTSTNVANGASCTVYTYPGTSYYVVIEDNSRSIVQLSGFGDDGWIPDPNISWNGGAIYSEVRAIHK